MARIPFWLSYSVSNLVEPFLNRIFTGSWRVPDQFDGISLAQVRALFEILGIVATTSGPATNSHKVVVSRFMRLRVPVALREEAEKGFASGCRPGKLKGDVSHSAFTLYGFQSNTKPARWLEPLEILDIVLRVAMSGGGFDAEASRIVDKVRATLGVPTRSYWMLRDTIAAALGVKIADSETTSRQEQPKTPPKSEKNEKRSDPPPTTQELKRRHACSVLGVDPKADQREIRTVYRRLVKECHPDMLSATATDDQRRASTQRFCQLREAYELLLM